MGAPTVSNPCSLSFPIDTELKRTAFTPYCEVSAGIENVPIYKN